MHVSTSFFKKNVFNCIGGILGLLLSLIIIPIQAATLDFEGLADAESILNYYDGGFGSLGSGPGPDFSVTASSGSLSIIQEGGSLPPNFGVPSGVNALTIGRANQELHFNVNTGFTSAQFFYLTSRSDTKVNIYSDFDGGGLLLASVTLSMITGNTFVLEQINFSGIGRSIGFTTGAAFNDLFDDLFLTAAIPEPNTVALFFLGIISIAFISCLRARKNIEPLFQSPFA